MEKIKYLFLFLIVFGCIPNDKTATEYYVLDNPLYNYDVEEKIKNLNITLPVPGDPIANYVPVSYTHLRAHET